VPDDVRSFEELMAELEAITERLATGEIGIEAAADLYEQAEKLHGLASARLGEVQARMERLAGTGDGSAAGRV
jgi:exodeoxyribonuclease VII small subunit